MSAPIEAVIVNYHTEELLEGLLPLLLKEPLVARVIVVDNSASLKASLPAVEVIVPEKNLGFGRAVNLGAQVANAPYLLVLNPDVRPLAGSIGALFEVAEQSGATLCGPRFFWDRERYWRLPPAEGEALFWALGKRLAQSLFPEALVLPHYWRIRQEHFWTQDRPFKEVFLSGAALLIDRRQLSGPPFDPRFFLYYEDTDLSFRVEAEGLLQLCVPQAEMVHFWNQSPDPPAGKERLFRESWEKLFTKYGLLNLWYKLAASLEGDLPLGQVEREFEPLEDPAMLSPGPEEVLELALNPLFIPYAQAGPFPGGILPPRLFDIVPPGRFFLRLVDRYGMVKRKFMLEKKTPREIP